MSGQQAVTHGHIRPDGTLEVEEKLDLPPGPVNVTVEVASQAGDQEDTWAVLQDIWAQRKAAGLKARSKEEIDAEIDALRNESEEEAQEIERLYGEIHRRQE